MAFMSKKTSERDYLCKGLTTCEGCGMELIARKMLQVLGPNTIILTPPSCSAIITGTSRETGWQVPAFMSNLESVGAYASGIRVGLEVLGRNDIQVVGFAGDGGTVDIGLQALSGAIERGHRFIYVCYDNEAYMNTGIQRSGATTLGAWTTTTPGGKTNQRKDVASMLLAQGIPYLATASVGYINDFANKINKARSVDGPSYIHVHTPCSTGWRFPAEQTIEVARMAVQTGMWVLYEAEKGKVRITRKVRNFKPVEEYLRLQKRFNGITAQVVQELRDYIREGYEYLQEREEKSDE